MNISGSYKLLPPEVSGALRYERVARYEAVLTLKEKQRRARIQRWTAFTIALTAIVYVLLNN